MKTVPFLLKGSFYLFLKSKHYDKQYSGGMSFLERLGHGVRANGRVICHGENFPSPCMFRSALPQVEKE